MHRKLVPEDINRAGRENHCSGWKFARLVRSQQSEKDHKTCGALAAHVMAKASQVVLGDEEFVESRA